MSNPKHQKTPSSKDTVSVSQLVEEHNHIQLISYPYNRAIIQTPNPNAQNTQMPITKCRVSHESMLYDTEYPDC
jgi:hypothetical protein